MFSSCSHLGTPAALDEPVILPGRGRSTCWWSWSSRGPGRFDQPVAVDELAVLVVLRAGLAVLVQLRAGAARPAGGRRRAGGSWRCGAGRRAGG
ncbi:MAG TPA: hypothetical protein VN969_09740, partial [Streptosporangiaceae bacterium]|nr:hypothetical protein [Streptosporangiaceae bacterium]